MDKKQTWNIGYGLLASLLLLWLQGTQPQELELVLLQAGELGLKGCAVYREGSVGGEAG